MSWAQGWAFTIAWTDDMPFGALMWTQKTSTSRFTEKDDTTVTVISLSNLNVVVVVVVNA